MGSAQLFYHMAGDQDRAKPIEEIASHQLTLLKQASDEDDNRVIPLSTIETQHYCEQKARFEWDEVPDKETYPERLILAQEQHGELIETTATRDEGYELEDVWGDISGGDVSLLYPPFAHEIVNVILVGRPTFIRFVDRRPSQLTLVRGVTKEAYLDRLFPNERFLLWCHGNLLDRIGFDVSALSIRYLKYPQSKFNAVEVSRAQMLLAAEDGDDITVRLDAKTPLHPNIRHHPLDYEQDSKRGKRLRQYAAFWRDGGEPTGAKHWKQCASCRFRSNCSLALGQGETRGET